MSILPIRLFPDPILRKKAKEIENINLEILEFSNNMLETMQYAKGIGLAAPQVGRLVRLITIQVPERDPIVMFNPYINKKLGKRMVPEGCLSVPGFTGIVERAISISATYVDKNKGKIQLSAEELLSQAIEHEIDHLNGIMYLDHLESHEKLHKTGITPDDIHWHDVAYKVSINKDNATKTDLETEGIIERKIELSKIKSDGSIEEASFDV
jgi:peptide deformylase|tara:strand:- start:4207 stop:4839 length:633 start_codon:yes stop_codon:yes gene_type:complete